MSYYTLLGIIEEARELDKVEAKKTPVDCPNDGAILLNGPDGVLYCPSDGWRPDHR